MLEKKKMLGEGPCLGEKVAEREEDFVLPEEQGDAGPGTAALRLAMERGQSLHLEGGLPAWHPQCRGKEEKSGNSLIHAVYSSVSKLQMGWCEMLIYSFF